MRRPPIKSPRDYDRLQLALREVIDIGGDIPCRRPDSNPDWWFSDDDREVYRAKERCRVCPVSSLCDTHASLQKEHGIWAARRHTERGGD